MRIEEEVRGRAVKYCAGPSVWSERASVRLRTGLSGCWSFPMAMEMKWQRDERQAMLASVQNT